MNTRNRTIVSAALAVVVVSVTVAHAAESRVNTAQAHAAVAEFKRVVSGCAAQDAACEQAAKRRFVEVVSCVVHGAPAADAATLERDFAGYVDVVANVLEARAPTPGPAGPCFASAAPAAPRPDAPVAAPAPKDEGPTAQTLGRFRKELEEQSQPVTATQVPPGPSPTDQLRDDINALRARQQVGSSTAPAFGRSGSSPSYPAATAAPPAPMPPAAGTTNIQGGPMTPPPAVAAPPPTTPPAPGTPYKYQLPPGTFNPAEARKNLTISPGVAPPAPGPTPVPCPHGQYRCKRDPNDVGTCVPMGTICN